MKKLVLLLALCLLVAPVLAQTASKITVKKVENGTVLIGIEGITVPTPTCPVAPTPGVPVPPTCPIGNEFEWITNPVGPDPVLLTVTNELINDTTIKVCWTYPSDFNPTTPGGVAFFEAIFLEESADSKDFKQVFEVGADQKTLLNGNKCIEMPITAPTETLTKSVGTFEGKIRPGYSNVNPSAPNGLKRRTLVVSGYSTGSGSIAISAPESQTGEVYVFSANTTEGYSRKMSLSIVPKASGEKSEVWMSVESTLMGISAQKTARNAVLVAERMVSPAVGYDYYFNDDAPWSIVDGSSSGAARTALAHALLSSKTLNDKVGVTGIINFDGGIGKIGGANLKAGAANSLGTTSAKFIFLVPQGQKAEVTTSYPNLTVKEVSTIENVIAELEGATGTLSTPAGTVVSGSKAVFLAKGLAPEIEDKRVVPTADLAFVSVNTGNQFQTKNPIANKIFLFDGAPEKITQAFELELKNIDKSKPLILGAGPAISCQNIATWVNQGKLQIDETWWTKTKGVASSALDWVKGALGMATDPQVQQGVAKVQSGEWLSGGAQITGAEVGRLLIGTIRVGKAFFKGVGVTLYEGGSAFIKEITQDVGIEAPAPGTDGSTSINVSHLLQEEGETPSKYLTVDAKTNNLYAIGNADWTSGRTIQPLWLVKKIDSKAVNPTNFKSGTETRFIACQFKTNAETGNQEVSASTEVTVQFGKTSCTNLLECLIKVNEKFLKIFTGS
ncbi:hypothetical protein KKE06_00375 [Candidatus Micrarchaeota archaeon]|nr:hypothetical protein [Candidatus Micrarchaeota archaeon]MBU1930465.1 hypothetical protein [Candidatus Micrarchaeota archaeon]